MFNLPLFYICFIVFGISRSVYSLGMLGPANFVYKSVELCPNASEGIRFEVSGRKVDRINFGITIQIDTPYDFDDQLGLILTACRHLDGGCKESFFQSSNNACTLLETMIGDVFIDLLKKAGIEGCPFPKGNYKVDDWIFDNAKFDNHVIYGDYSAKFILTHKGIEQSCIILNCEMVAKNKF